MAVSKAPDQPMIQAMLGHALLATEKDNNLPEAEKVLRAAIGRDNEQPFAWYQLGVIYDRKGDQPRAALATAETLQPAGRAQACPGQRRAGAQGHSPGHPRFPSCADIAMVAAPRSTRTARAGDADQ
jgi:predicted Zn-dependent protease